MNIRPDGRPPFRADHVGSLLRPPALRQAFRRRAAGAIDDDEFARIQDDAIRAALRMQEEIGFEVVTDGEFRRGSLELISSKTPVLESLDFLRRRTEAAASYIDLDRLAISPQCGFASSAAGNPLGAADERAKLRLVVDAARAVWGGVNS